MTDKAVKCNSDAWTKLKISSLKNYASVDGLGVIVHRQDADKIAQELVYKLKYTVLRKSYPTLAQVEAIARVDIPPIRKNSTS